MPPNGEHVWLVSSEITCALLRNKKRRQKGKKTKQNKNKKHTLLEWAETFFVICNYDSGQILTLDTK